MLRKSVARSIGACERTGFRSRLSKNASHFDTVWRKRSASPSRAIRTLDSVRCLDFRSWRCPSETQKQTAPGWLRLLPSAGLEQHHKTNTGMNLNQAAD
jgi:hypothetical protein